MDAAALLPKDLQASGWGVLAARMGSGDKPPPSPSRTRSPRLSDPQPKTISTLSSHPGCRRREAPGRKDHPDLACPQPGGGISEGRDEVPVALVELPADLPARRVESRRGRFLQFLRRSMRLLGADRGGTSGRLFQQLALPGRLALDDLDLLRYTPPILGDRKVCPAGKDRK